MQFSQPFCFLCPLVEERMLNKTHKPLCPKVRFPSTHPCPNPIRNHKTLLINAIVTLLVLGIKIPSKLLLTMRVIKVTKTILFLVKLHMNFLLFSLGPTGLQEHRNHSHYAQYAIQSLEFFEMSGWHGNMRIRNRKQGKFNLFCSLIKPAKIFMLFSFPHTQSHQFRQTSLWLINEDNFESVRGNPLVPTGECPSHCWIPCLQGETWLSTFCLLPLVTRSYKAREHLQAGTTLDFWASIYLFIFILGWGFL